MSNVHRHTAGPEHDFEPQPGLPERLPAQERLLWQGAPDWRALAAQAFHLRKLALYFGLLVAARATVVLHDGGSAAEALRALAWPLPLAALGLGLVALLAWLSARSTLYTVTDRRVVMRIGIVLTITFNLPYRRMAGADLRAAPRGCADIALQLSERHTRLAWLTLWPHARPWRVARTQPMLRCVPDGQAVGALIARHWSLATGQPAAPAAVEPALPPRLQPGLVPASGLVPAFKPGP
jgi:hypothetical protein